MPVLEGTWLDDDTFAVVRARVRGSTLDQTASAVGKMPPARIAAALDELTTAPIWARRRHHQPLRRAGDVRLPTGQRTRAPRLRAVGAHRRRRRDDRIDRTPAERRRLPRRQRIHRAPRRTANHVDARRRSRCARQHCRARTTADREVAVPVGSDAAVIERPNRGRAGLHGARVLTTFAVIGAIGIGAIVLFMRHRSDEARLLANAGQDQSGTRREKSRCTRMRSTRLPPMRKRIHNSSDRPQRLPRCLRRTSTRSVARTRSASPKRRSRREPWLPPYGTSGVTGLVDLSAAVAVSDNDADTRRR